MAGIVDLKTGRIIGVKEGSLAWLHEKGHLEYNKHPWSIRVQFYMESFLILTVVFLAFGQFFNHIFFKLLPASSAFLFMVLYAFEELWCWKYALQEANNRLITSKETKNNKKSKKINKEA